MPKLASVNPKWALAIDTLVTTGSCTKAAEACSVRIETVAGWRGDPEFQARYAARVAEIRKEGDEKLARLRGKALAVFEEELNRPLPEALATQEDVAAARLRFAVAKYVEDKVVPPEGDNAHGTAKLPQGVSSLQEARDKLRRLRKKVG